MHSSFIMSSPSKYQPESNRNIYEKNRLRQLIRFNDPEKIIRSSSVTTSPMLARYESFDELNNAHQSLTRMKKEFNAIRAIINRKESDIQLMKQDVEQLIMQEQKIQAEVTTNIENLRDYKNSFDIIKSKYNEEFMNLKTYQHMIDRQKRDNLVNRNKTDQMSQDAKMLQDIIEKERHEYFMQKQCETQSQIVLNKLLETTEFNSSERGKQLLNFQQSVSKKKEEEFRKFELKKVQDQLTEDAKEFQNSNEKKFRRLLLVHKFLNLFLKNKMELLMQNFSPLEQAFQKIKAQTVNFLKLKQFLQGISDTTEITRKFLNREKTYGFVLISISEYEKKIEELMKQNYELKKKFNFIKEELVPLENAYTTKVDQQKMKEYHRQLEDFMFRYKRGKVLKDKLHRWIIKMLVVMSKVNNLLTFQYFSFKIDGNYNSENIYDKYPEENMKEAFTDLHQKVITMIKEVQSLKQQVKNNRLCKVKQDANDILQNLNRSMLEETQDSNEMFLKRNIRVSADSRIFDPENDSIFLNLEDDSYAKQRSLLKSVEENSLSEKDINNDDETELTFLKGIREKQKINDYKEKQKRYLEQLKEKEDQNFC